MKGNKKLLGVIAAAAVVLVAGLAVVFGLGKLGHTHEYTEWGYDDTQHWKVCEADGAESKHEDHVFDPNNNYLCECGYQHTHDYEWQHDDNEHWQVCTVDGYQTAKTRHNYNGDGLCECGATTEMATLTGTVKLYRNGVQEQDYTGVTFTMKEVKTNYTVSANAVLDSKTGSYTVKVPAGDTAYELTISKTDYTPDSIGFTAQEETLRDAELVYISFAPTESLTYWGKQDYSTLKDGIVSLDNDVQVIFSKDTYKTVAFSVTLQPDWNSWGKDGRQGVIFRFMNDEEYAGVVAVQTDCDKSVVFDGQTDYSKWWCGDNTTELALADGYGWDGVADLNARTDLKAKLTNGTLTLTVLRDGATFYVFAGDEYLGSKSFPAKYANMECQVGFYYLNFKPSTMRKWHIALDETGASWMAKVPFGSVNAEVKKQKFDDVQSIPDGTKIAIANVGTPDVKNNVTVKNGRIVLPRLAAGDYKLSLGDDYSYILTVKPNEKITDPITIGYEAFSPTAGMEYWGSVRNFNLQNQGIIVLNNDMQFIFSRDTFKGGSFTMTFQKDWNSAGKDGRQGIAFRFIDPKDGSYAGMVAVQTEGDKVLQFDANEGYAEWWNDAGVDSAGLTMAEGSSWEWLVDLQAEENKGLRAALNNGTMKVTVAREGATFYVFAEGKYVGKKTFPDKYKDMPAQIGFYYLDFLGNQTEAIRSWDFDINSNAASWINRVPFGTIDGQLYSKEYRGNATLVPSGAKVTVSDGKDSYTVTVGQNGEFKLKRIVSGYYTIRFELNGKTYSRRVFVGEGTNSGAITCGEELFAPTETMANWGYFNGDDAVDGKITVSNDIQYIFSKNRYKDVAFSLNLTKDCPDKEQGVLVRFRSGSNYEGLIALRKQYYIDERGKAIYKIQFSKVGCGVDAWKLKDKELDVADGSQWYDLAFFEGGENNRTDLKALADKGDLWLTVVRKGNTLYGYIGDEMLGHVTIDPKYADMECEVGFYYNFYPTSINHTWYFDLDVGNTKWAGSVNAPLQMKSYGKAAEAVPNGTEVTVTNGTNTYKTKVTNGKLQLSGVVGDSYTISFSVNGKNYVRTVEVGRGATLSSTITCGEDLFAPTETMKYWGTVRNFDEAANGTITLNNDTQFIFSKNTYQDVAFTITLQKDWNNGKDTRQGIMFRFMDNGKYAGTVGVQTQKDQYIQIDGTPDYNQWWNMPDGELTVADGVSWDNAGLAELKNYPDLKEKLNNGELKLTVVRSGATFYVFADGEYLGARTFSPAKYQNMPVQVGFYYRDFNGNTTRDWKFDLQTENVKQDWLTGTVKTTAEGPGTVTADCGNNTVDVDKQITVTMTPTQAANTQNELKSLKVNGRDVAADKISYNSTTGSYTYQFYAGRGENTVAATFGEVAKSALKLKLESHKYGTQGAMPEGTEVTLSRPGFTWTKEVGANGIWEENVYAGTYDVQASGYLIGTVEVAGETCHASCTLEYDAFMNTPAMATWGGDTSDFSGQNNGTLHLANDMLFVQAKDAFKQVAFTLKLSNEGNQTQGIFVRFKNEAGYQGIVTVCADGDTSIKFDGENYAQKAGNDWHIDEADFEQATGAGYQDLVFFKPTEIQQQYSIPLRPELGEELKNGNLKLTVVRDGNTIAVYVNGEYFGQRAFDGSYADMDCEVGLYYLNYPNKVARDWKYALTTDIDNWNSISVDAELKQQAYKQTAATVANGTKVTITGDNGTETATVQDGKLKFTPQAEGTYTIDFTVDKVHYIGKATFQKGQNTAAITCEQDMFAPVCGTMASWNAKVDYSQQAEGKIGIRHDMYVLFSKDLYDDAAMTLTLKGKNANWKTNDDESHQGIAFRFKDENGYQGVVGIEGSIKRENGNYTFAIKNHGAGEANAPAQLLWMDWMSDANATNILAGNWNGYNTDSVMQQSLAAGGGKLTVVRRQNNFYVFFNGTYLGSQSIDEKYANMQCEVGFFYNNMKNKTDSSWNSDANIWEYDLDTNVSGWLSTDNKVQVVSHKYGTTEPVQNATLTFTNDSTSTQVTVADGVADLSVLPDGTYTVKTDQPGYLEAAYTKAAGTGGTITLEYDAFALTPGIKQNWKLETNFARQNDNQIMIKNDAAFVYSNDTFGTVAFTLDLHAENTANDDGYGDGGKEGTQEIVFRFKDETGYQGMVGIQNGVDDNAHKRVIRFDGNDYAGWKWPDVGNEWTHTGPTWQWISDGYQDIIARGDMKLTVLRDGATFSIFANKVYLGSYSVDPKYADMECEVGFGYYDFKWTETYWNFELDTNPTEWLSLVPASQELEAEESAVVVDEEPADNTNSETAAEDDSTAAETKPEEGTEQPGTDAESNADAANSETAADADTAEKSETDASSETDTAGEKPSDTEQDPPVTELKDPETEPAPPQTSDSDQPQKTEKTEAESKPETEAAAEDEAQAKAAEG